MKRYYLEVPYQERMKVKDQGARWDPDHKQWYVENAVPESLKPWFPYPVRFEDRAMNLAFALSVAFEDKDKVKDLGAVWEPSLKAWFAPWDRQEALAEWKVQPPVLDGGGLTPEEGFKEALRAAGLIVDHVEMDGKLRRVPVEGAPGGRKDGAYVGFQDGLPAGFIQNFYTGLKTSWRAQIDPEQLQSTPTHQKMAWKAQNELSRVKREIEREQLQLDRSDYALRVWSQASDRPDDPEATYLERKNVLSWSVRFKGNDVIVPVHDADGILWSYQVLPSNPEEGKRFLKDGRKSGCFCLIGEIRSDQALLVAEGYATGASLHEATGLPVAVAFDAYNLREVCMALKDAHPGQEMWVCADDDRYPKPDRPFHNTGIEKATEINDELGIGFVSPKFKDLSTKPTDFNDLAQLQGLEAIREQLSPYMNLAAAKRSFARAALSQSL